MTSDRGTTKSTGRNAPIKGSATMAKNKYIVKMSRRQDSYIWDADGSLGFTPNVDNAKRYASLKRAQKDLEHLRAQTNKPFPNATILKPAKKRYVVRLSLDKYFLQSNVLKYTDINGAKVFSKKKHAAEVIALNQGFGEDEYIYPKIIRLKPEKGAEWVEALPRPNPCPICKAKPTLKETKDRGMDWCEIHCPKHGNFGAWKGQSDDKSLSRGAAIAGWNDAILAIPNPKLCPNCESLPEIRDSGLVGFELYEVVAQCQTCEGCGVGQSTGEAIASWNKMAKKTKQNPSSQADNAIVQGISTLEHWGVLKWETSKLGTIVFMEKPIGFGMSSGEDWGKMKHLGWEPAISSIEGEPCDVWIHKIPPTQAPEIAKGRYEPTSNYQKGIKLLGNLLIKPKAIGKKDKTHFTRRLSEDMKKSLEGLGFRIIPSPSQDAKLMAWVFEPPKRKIANFIAGCKVLQDRSIEETVIGDGDIEVYLTDYMDNNGTATTALKNAGWVNMDDGNKEWRYEW